MDSFVALFYLVQLVLILVFLRKVVDLLLALVVFPLRFNLVVVLVVSLKILYVQLLLVSFHVVFWFQIEVTSLLGFRLLPQFALISSFS